MLRANSRIDQAVASAGVASRTRMLAQTATVND